MVSNFTVIKTDSKSRARLGRLTTAHGEVETPAFMPVGTQGTVKAMLPRDLKELGCQIVLCNTYHLYLRPGHEAIRELGGLHRLMGWNGPILTDSGGYQVFSLAMTRKISEEGVCFQSQVDGSSHLLTPEAVVEIQAILGSDIAMVLDECAACNAPRDYVEKSMERTIRWAGRSLRDRGDGNQLMFGIIQGGTFEDLRRRCAQEITPMPFDGFAVGGLGVGESEDLLRSMSALTLGLLPDRHPRYLMGIGRPQDIVQAVRSGADMFDCVLPTRNARNGTLFTSRGKLNIKRAEYARDPRPLDEACSCYCCQNFSRAYLRHLFMAREILSAQLNTLHNLYFYLQIMTRCREAIRTGRAELWDQASGAGLPGGSEEEP